MEDQCLDCYFVSDRSNDRKQINICDHTAHPEWYGHDIIREIPKDYDCSHFNAEKKPMILMRKIPETRGRPKKIKDSK